LREVGRFEVAEMYEPLVNASIGTGKSSRLGWASASPLPSKATTTGTQQQYAMPPNYNVGQRVSFSSALCTIRYIGPVQGTEKEWLGVEWDDPSRGRHDGEHKGFRYFTCK
jgi:hypothetical protein